MIIITIMIIIIMIIQIIIIIIIWLHLLRRNGVNTNGAAAKVIRFERLGEKVRPGTFGKIKVG